MSGFRIHFPITKSTEMTCAQLKQIDTETKCDQYNNFYPNYFACCLSYYNNYSLFVINRYSFHRVIRFKQSARFTDTWCFYIVEKIIITTTINAHFPALQNSCMYINLNRGKNLFIYGHLRISDCKRIIQSPMKSLHFR